MKIGRNEFDINEKDIILDNGLCYQLVTRKVFSGWHDYSPIVSKTLFNKLKKVGAIYTNYELEELACKKYKANGLRYWMFDMNKVNKIGL